MELLLILLQIITYSTFQCDSVFDMRLLLSLNYYKVFYRKSIEKYLKELIDLIESKTISSKQGKDVFYKCLEDKKSPKQVVKDEGMMQITDSSEIESVIDEVINEKFRKEFSHKFIINYSEVEESKMVEALKIIEQALKFTAEKDT